MTCTWEGLRFGLGLLEIGRPWGHSPSEVPGAAQSVTFLHEAFSAGVRLFDTAPSYAHSETRLGAFLSELNPAQRSSLTIATKFGETWNFEKNAVCTDHSYDALMRSLESSLTLLGRIDILQVHKSTADVLRSADLRRALDEARNMGIQLIGASLKDMDAARVAFDDARIGLIQIPFNRRDRRLLPALRLARQRGRMVFTNRPFAMGELLGGTTVHSCVEGIINEPFDGAILFGTSSAAHLRENLEAFQAAS